MTTLADVVAAHRLHASMNVCRARTCHWCPVADAGSLADQHADHVIAAVTAWIGERLSGSREDVADGLIAYETTCDFLEDTSIGGYADAALAVVAAALGVEVGS